LLNISKLKNSPSESQIKIGILGGSKKDSEILVVKSLFKNSIVTTIGIEESDMFLDFNYELCPTLMTETFDWLLCSQVIEHVWNHDAFFKNITQLSGPGTHLWLAGPAVNHPHGSPDFFSLGFTHEYMAKNLSRFAWKILSSGQIGSKRLYFSATVLGRWLSVKEHNQPILQAISLNKMLTNFYHRLRFTDLVEAKFKSKKVAEQGRFVTESCIWAESNY
jgi:SAM-dependent methyltransferase